MAALAWPFFLNSSVQAVLNLTDTWFVGRLSANAVAAMGAIYWAALALIIFMGGLAMAVQTFVAQAYGGRRKHRASHVLWTGFYAALLTTPIFLAAGWFGPALIARLGVAPDIAALAAEYWWPRMLGGPASIALWAFLSFFNGIGRPRVSLVVNVIVALANAVLNELLIFHLEMGMAGAAWATSAALLLGLLIMLAIALAPAVRREYATHRTWRPRWNTLRALVALGMPTGLMVAFDIVAMAIFQVIQVRLGAVDGAATQIVMMATSIAYMPAVGIGLAGTTLVGQAIGAGDRDWAMKVGNVAILMAVIFMTCIGVLLGLSGPWLMRLFVPATDPLAADVIALGATLMWIAACYQLFDGLNIGSGFCLRGAGDARVPAIALAIISWLVFIPLTHMLAFAPGQGYVHFLPQFGLGAAGGWIAAVVYVFCLGTFLVLRWRSRAWQRIALR